MKPNDLKRRIRWLIAIFVVGLVLAGLTAFPIQIQVNALHELLATTPMGALWPAMTAWLTFVNEGINNTYANYPFLAYGTDWLAYAHIVIAIAFWGPFRDPVRNKWVIDFGIMACVLIFPTAMICGQIREIPFFWRLIDCSFGVGGLLPLFLIRHYIGRLSSS